MQVLRVISLVHITILPLTALALSPSLFSLQNGNTALAIARRLGYISVVDTLKVVTEEITTTTTVSCRCIKMSLSFIQNVVFLFFPQTLHVSLSFLFFFFLIYFLVLALPPPSVGFLQQCYNAFGMSFKHAETCATTSGCNFTELGNKIYVHTDGKQLFKSRGKLFF